jgi:hypothetical protein
VSDLSDLLRDHRLWVFLAALLLVAVASFASMPAHGQPGWLPQSPSIYPGCPNNRSPDGTVPAMGSPDPCWKTLDNWQPIPACALPFSGTVATTYLAICHFGGCAPYPGGDDGVPEVIARCLTR